MKSLLIAIFALSQAVASAAEVKLAPGSYLIVKGMKPDQHPADFNFESWWKSAFFYSGKIYEDQFIFATQNQSSNQVPNLKSLLILSNYCKLTVNRPDWVVDRITFPLEMKLNFVSIKKSALKMTAVFTPDTSAGVYPYLYNQVDKSGEPIRLTGVKLSFSCVGTHPEATLVDAIGDYFILKND